ncbi:hypothetical protein TGARI_273280A [Toxoplasma gondii ARI]|uniref:Transmembrane protein n=1 Tax=Toxoplasma gondii ARI TaxID=1074872 RepID=A0A139Y600_TOXGO|nr:hypothetical protein TGARI_273280A [Toxoplasma gondii ARI]
MKDMEATKATDECGGKSPSRKKKREEDEAHGGREANEDEDFTAFALEAPRWNVMLQDALETYFTKYRFLSLFLLLLFCSPLLFLRQALFSLSSVFFSSPVPSSFGASPFFPHTPRIYSSLLSLSFSLSLLSLFSFCPRSFFRSLFSLQCTLLLFLLCIRPVSIFSPLFRLALLVLFFSLPKLAPVRLAQDLRFLLRRPVHPCQLGTAFF